MNRRTALAPAAALAAALAAGCAADPAPPRPDARAEAPDGTPGEGRIVATLPPLAWLADRLTGRDGAAATLLDGRSSPHATEPDPSALRALERAGIWVAVGGRTVPAERAWERQARARPLAVVRLARGGSDPPHPWLDPAAMRGAAEALAAELESRGVAGTRTRLAATLDEIGGVERDVRSILDGSTARPADGKLRFWVDHPAWEAFAHAFELEQVALEREGKEPGPAELARLTRRAREEGVRTLIVARGARHPAAEVFAAETGAHLVVLDPLARDWPATMRAAARTIAGTS